MQLRMDLQGWLLLVVLNLFIAPNLTAQTAAPARPPLIDMHLHAEKGTSQQNWDEVLRGLAAHDVVLAMLSVDDPTGVSGLAPGQVEFWIGPSFPCYDGRFPDMDPCFSEDGGWPDLEWLRSQYESGRMRVMGELLYVYYGIPPVDERLEPFWELAAELDVPVGVHTGRRPRESLPDECCPHYDDDLGNPALLAPVLERHPGLRLWLMHAPGWDYLDETIALMEAHPNVYAEMSVVNSVMPAEMHERHLRAMEGAGLLDRVMLGSDNMPIGLIVERIETVPFLTEEQKRAIYCGNAARFLQLDPAVCAPR